MNNQDRMEARIKLFIDLPEVVRNKAFEKFRSDFDHIDYSDEDHIFTILAYSLMGEIDSILPFRKDFEDSPIKYLRTMSVVILIQFYSIEEVLELIDNPEYKATPYETLKSSQDKIIVAMAREMLTFTGAVANIDHISNTLKDRPSLREIILQGSLGKLGWAGMRSRESAHEGAANRKENNKPREEWLIQWALELDKSSNGRLSITELSKSMHRKEDEWRKEEYARLSADRIYKIIKKAVRDKRKLATRA